MKKLLSLFFAISLTLSACGTVSTQPALPAQTETPTITPTATQTPTATITPLPTIPTFTPTFDVSTIVTVTPAEKAECPVIQENAQIDIINYENGFEEKIIEHLNQGVPIEKITTALNKGMSEFYKTPNLQLANYQEKDITKDGTAEIIFSTTGIMIIGCQNGKFATFLILPPDSNLFPPNIIFAEDNNQNGLPELTLRTNTQSQGARTYQIFEWDGLRFQNIISPEDTNYPEYAELRIQTTGEIYYQDINGDSVKELVVENGIPIWTTYPEGLPWRNEHTFYQWDGQYFSPMYSEFDKPEYRFQAIQDGDLATNQAEFDKALSLYQDAISDSNLKQYSQEIRFNLQENWFSQIGVMMPYPTPSSSDPIEHPYLAAYAYYRIMLLHLVQGQEAEAVSTYQTLQDTFGSNQYAAPYVEMATAFWEAYQPTRKMYDGCAAAIQYAVEHPEILTPLGSDYHGWQSHTYVPADVCPFR
jgi:hypothetical protein